MDIKDNLVFIVDSSKAIVYFNEKAKEAFPKMEIGVSCCEATQSGESRCAQCPMITGNPEGVPIFNMNLLKWIQMSYANMEYPGHGTCTVVTGTFYTSLEKEILGRIKFMNKYDFVMEMNLTINRYVMFSEGTYGQPLVLEEEPLDVLLHRTADTMVHPDDYKKFCNLMNLTTLSERLKNAKYPLTEVIRERNTRGTFDDVTVSIIPEAISQDGDEMVLAFFHIEHMHDSKLKSKKERNSLTGLLEKEAFIKEAEEFFRNYHEDVAIIYMDIEHFRFFNKWYSRWQGDRLLKSIGLNLLQMDRMFSTVSGYGGGDNFFILCDKQEPVLNYLIENLNDLINSFDGIEGFRMTYGGYEIKNKTEDIEDAIDAANTAASYDSSSIGKIRWYESNMISDEEKEMMLIPDFERGLEDGEFTFFLQPKCNIDESRIVGAEALVRWKHKHKGYVSPGEFIPVLERKGLVYKLDAYIWEEVCRKMGEWKKTGLELVPVSINVSRADIFNLDVPAVLESLVKKYDVPTDLIEVEITESAFVNDLKIIRDAISRLRKTGFRILIDDFGSGYSSLNMLKDVQADVIKMDIKFFDLNSENFEKGLNIISSVFEMAYNIGLPIIAEGVETQAQINILESLGFNYVQGYFYYKPLPLADYEVLISDVKNISHKEMKIQK